MSKMTLGGHIGDIGSGLGRGLGGLIGGTTNGITGDNPWALIGLGALAYIALNPRVAGIGSIPTPATHPIPRQTGTVGQSQS